MTSDAELVAQARTVIRPRQVSQHNSEDVGCALLAADGKVYLGVCIDVSCGIGFCAEHSAIAAMVTAGEHRIRTIVAVYKDGSILPPCGRCREFMHQLHPDNRKTRVILPDGVSKTLEELLPHPW